MNPPPDFGVTKIADICNDRVDGAGSAAVLSAPEAPLETLGESFSRRFNLAGAQGSTMYLFRLMYVSTAIDEFTAESLEELAQSSARANLVRGITGVLLFAGGNFLQVIEGRRSEIDVLFTKITRDPRHSCIERVQYGAIARRMFPEWAMTLRNLDDARIAGPREFRVIREFLDQCGGVDVDQETRAMISYFQARVAEHV